MEAMHRGAMMNRRQLLYSLTSFSASTLTVPLLFSLEANGHASAERGGDPRAPREARRAPYEPLRVGLVGVAGVGVYWQYRIARQMDYPHNVIAIETNANNDRLRWRHPDDASLLLIGSHDEFPATVVDAHRMALERKPDIAKLVSDLDVAFLVTGLNGIIGKGVTTVVAETLRESGVFTIAIVPGRREADAINSLRQRVDAAWEIPYAWEAAPPGAQDPLWREHLAATIAWRCRAVTLSLV
jgi:hypothetical protein